jgi:hypothetical protein
MMTVAHHKLSLGLKVAWAVRWVQVGVWEKKEWRLYF